jgi:hypothetical protein
VPRAIFAHCGSRIVAGDERVLDPEIRHIAEERGIEAEIAHDGMEVVLRYVYGSWFSESSNILCLSAVA